MKQIAQLAALFITLSAFLFPARVKAQVVINEFLASNTGTNVDPDYGESADWIEIYNAGNSLVDIGGYYLTDNFNNTSKWQIPEGTQIEPQGFLLIWADGYDNGLHTNFKISADGEELAILNQNGIFIDSVSFGFQEPNISLGRKPDGGAAWNFFPEPSPGATNNTQNYEGIVKNTPQFTPLGGIFNALVTVSVSNSFGGDMRYTLDGSEPTENSPVLNSNLQIDSTTVVRVRIFKENQVPGETVTNTYFIDENNSIGKLPVVSLASDPANFWDTVQGIYVQDFKPEWEIPINIELFENDGSDRAGFNLAAGTKINGLYSWQLPQKMLGIYFRKEYGKGKLEYPLLFDRDRSAYDDFALRASGSDWAFTLFRDGMAQTLTADNMDVDFQGIRPCVVFVNGAYMGIHNIRSKVNEDFIVQNHQLGDRKIDMVENENFVEAGSLDQYTVFEALYHKDLSIQANYDAVAALMDIENFTDFIISEIYSQNTSVDHNIMAWKPQDGGKWKWILNDLDRTFFNAGNNMINFYAGKNVIPFSALLKNDDYRHYFGKRLADHLFTTFDPDRVKKMIDEFSANIEEEVPKHIERWKGTSSDYGDPIPSVEYWNNEIDKMKTFAEHRPSALLNDLQNYGFAASKSLALLVSPANAGTVNFNGIKIKQAESEGAYPKNEEIKLFAEAKSGKDFIGWKILRSTAIVEKEAVWKYNDSGTAAPATWRNTDFDDSEWKEGQAELGYGDGDENTLVDFGGDGSNKHITTYFRKKFVIEDPGNLDNLKVNLKCDDGAVVYLNGVEVMRENMPAGEIVNSTRALTAIGGSDESDFLVYPVDKALLDTGNNVVAVEIHQANPTSSDISFDLQLTAFSPDSSGLITSNSLTFTHTEDLEVIALFESDGSCIVPEEIAEEMILKKECSPYRVPDEVVITESGNLIVEPGVEIWFSDNVSMHVTGKLETRGTSEEPVVFRSNPESKNHKWGNLNFVNADTSYLTNIIIEDASKGGNPIREIAAVSAFNSVVIIDGAVIENVHENPVLGRYSDITMKNSRLHSGITGDLINIKYGKGFIDRCEFIGNDLQDTDAIDYDDVENGVIRNSFIRDFHGFNSDAIDIGERARNITIENMLVYNITDKGVSVGQQSSANILNSVFVNCNLGAGLKDSSRVNIDHCTYYGNGTSVATYEKNEGDAGANVRVTNSILSNAYDASYFSDSKSTIEISHSSSDNDELPFAESNLFADPQFANPNLFDFSLLAASPCIGAASSGNIGADLSIQHSFNQVFISAIAYKSNTVSEVNEFIKITNPGSSAIDISAYVFTKGITFTFPENTILEPGKDVYVAYNRNADFWYNKNRDVYQWESGRLADEGEAVRLETPRGIIIDQVHYNVDESWPEIANGEGISLKSNELDNHFGKNWKKNNLNTLLNVKSEDLPDSKLAFYPNPTNGVINISGLDTEGSVITVFTLTGIPVKSETLNANQAQMDIRNLPEGMYLLRCGSYSQQIILLK